jgi:predicted anti-sigma-YlaC factor YlaD
MKCKNAEVLLLLQDSGEVAGHQADALAAHLGNCEHCRRFQAVLTEARVATRPVNEPREVTLQNVKRFARQQAPSKRPIHLFGLKPALAMAASVVIGLGIFLSAFSPGKVGMELDVTETQLLESEDQMVDVMYSGLSEDNLAFNFLMTFEEG